MKRMIVHLSVALIAFLVGVACEIAFSSYLESTSVLDASTQPAVIALATPLPSETVRTELAPTSLPAKLQHIDETYRKRCDMPTEWRGGWPTIRQLSEFRACNDEWATARREAINAELENYMVQY